MDPVRMSDCAIATCSLLIRLLPRGAGIALQVPDNVYLMILVPSRHAMPYTIITKRKSCVGPVMLAIT